MKLTQVQKALDDRVQLLKGRRRAAVAMILRKTNHKTAGLEDDIRDMEIFFILRAVRENSSNRWSGQVAFPGGMQEEGETDFETAVREADEEVGLNLMSEQHFKYIGRIHDRQIPGLVVAAFVFLQTAAETPALSLAPSEVGACGWAPVKQLLDDDCIMPLAMHQGMQFAGMWGLPRQIKFLVKPLGLHTCLFTGVNLDMRDVVVTQRLASKAREKGQDPPFLLWGMTLYVINDFLENMIGLRETRLVLRQEIMGFKVDRCFKSPLHNLNYAAMRRLNKAVRNENLSYGQYIFLTTSSVAGLTLAGASTATLNLLSKL